MKHLEKFKHFSSDQTKYIFDYGSGYLNRQSATFFISETTNHNKNKLQAIYFRKNEVSEMIESKNDTSKNLEKALQALKQAQQRVANEKKKQNEKKRKAENHHKYIMGGIIVKYFPDCYRYDEGELKRILSVALQTKKCQQIISKIKAESRETTPPQSTLPNAENESEGGTE